MIPSFGFPDLMVIHGQFIPVGIPVPFSFSFVKETLSRFPQFLQSVVPPWSIFIPLGSAKGAVFSECVNKTRVNIFYGGLQF